MVGYSRLMQADEAGTHQRLKAYLAVFDTHISQGGGRIVGTAGDAVLADFPSVVDAVSAAVAIQAALAERNAGLSPDGKLEFRIGINLGDVIVDADDIFGDGVNVAARLESLADPGGIVVSAAVYDQVKDKLALPLVDRGEVRVKNIADPVRVYAVGLGERPLPKQDRRSFGRVTAAAGVALVLLLAGLGAFWIAAPSDPVKDARDTDAEAETESKPTIAVLPFEEPGAAGEETYFADGITEGVTTEFGRFSNLFVLSWNAVAPYKGKAVAPEQLSEDLNVRYVVGGTLRRTDGRLRLTVQLTDARRGLLLWSERYDRDIADIFALQDDIARQVVGALAVRLTRLEQDRVFRKPTEKLDAYDYVLRGRHHLRRVERSANLEARALFERALEIDPRYVDALVALGWSHMNGFLYGWTEWQGRALARARELAEQAVTLDDRHAAAHALLAQALTFQGELAQATETVERAIELNPNDPVSHAILGNLTMWSGDPAVAAQSLELALRLDPEPVVMWVVNLGLSYYLLGRYEDTVRLLERISRRFNENPVPPAVLAAAHGQLGQRDQAAAALARLKRVSPFFDAGGYAGNFSDPSHTDHLLEGLAKAGLE